ncbi:MAG: amidohydrolase [Myxococcota bacterium]
MLRRRRFVGLGLGMLASACAKQGTATPQGATGPASLIVQGRVLTLDPARPSAEAVAVAGGRILAVGSLDEIAGHRGPQTEIVDVGDGLITPGLVDAHAHLAGLGRGLEEVDLRGSASVEEVVKRLHEHDRGQPWLTGRGWDQNLWPGGAMPTHDVLSAAFPDRPVWLRRVDGHAGWANAAAMKASGIEPGRKSPEGGEILVSVDGQPTGVLIDAAMALMNPPTPTEADLRRQLDAAQQHVLERGLTGVHDMGVGPMLDAIYRETATRSDVEQRLRLRVWGYADSSWLPELAPQRRADRPGPEDLYALVGVKVYADGALGSRGAALLAPYHDRPDHTGLMQRDPEALRALYELAVEHGYQIATHAIGDAANRAVLDGYQAVIEANGLQDARLRVEHAQILHPDDIPRFAELGVIASMQPTHATSDMAWVPDRVGPERVSGAYAWRRILDAKGHLCFGSDFPVELVDVTHGLYSAITRADPKGQPAGGWTPDQLLSLEEAIAAFSRDAAYAGFSEGYLGTIVEGARADFSCFRDDLRTLDPAGVRDAVVAATIVDGLVRYRA